MCKYTCKYSNPMDPMGLLMFFPMFLLFPPQFCVLKPTALRSGPPWNVHQGRCVVAASRWHKAVCSWSHSRKCEFKGVFKITLPETNISPENGGPLEKEIPIGNHPFSGAKMLVSGNVL